MQCGVSLVPLAPSGRAANRPGSGSVPSSRSHQRLVMSAWYFSGMPWRWAIGVIAHDGRNAALTDEGNRFIRSGAIAGQIAEVIDRIRLCGVDGSQNRFCGGTVAEHVREDGDTGRHEACSRYRVGLPAASHPAEPCRRYQMLKCTLVLYRGDRRNLDQRVVKIAAPTPVADAIGGGGGGGDGPRAGGGPTTHRQGRGPPAGAGR